MDLLGDVAYSVKKNTCDTVAVDQIAESCFGETIMHEWAWDTSLETPRLQLSEKNLEVRFHPNYSTGTAAIRGDKKLSKGAHYYWEIKMLTPIYGTDVMVGVGTSKANLNLTDTFCSLLGNDTESWGFSYRGYIQHNNQIREYTSSFAQGDSVGVHLDTFRGTLQFFLNRKPLGIAFQGLNNIDLYPMVCSTAAKSKMKIMYSNSMPISLQMECLGVLKPWEREYISRTFPSLKYLSNSVFTEILRKPEDSDDDDSDSYDLPNEMIFDDLDYAIIGCRRKRRRRKSCSVY